MRPEEILGWRYIYSYGCIKKKAKILDKITEGKRVQRALGPRTVTVALEVSMRRGCQPGNLIKRCQRSEKKTKEGWCPRSQEGGSGKLLRR